MTEAESAAGRSTSSASPTSAARFSSGYLPRTLWATGQPSLPVLVLDGKAIADSTRIIEALERLQPEPPLHPADEGERQRALEDFFDEEGPWQHSAAPHSPSGPSCSRFSASRTR